jgi:hypothetical protein
MWNYNHMYLILKKVLVLFGTQVAKS